MLDMATIGAAYEGLKATKDIIKGMYALKLDTATQEKINAAVSKVGDAQDTLFSVRETLFQLQEDNERLKRELQEAQEWKMHLNQYELVKAVGGAMVYKFKADPLHYACPTCMSKKDVQILQDFQDGYGTYACHQCKSNYSVDQADPSTPIYDSSY